MALRCLPRPLVLLGSCSLLVSIMIHGVHAQSPCAACPGDLNDDHVVTVDELITAANAALNGCGAPFSSLLQTGQTQCAQADGTFGACPGSPPGQDGAVQAGVPFSYIDLGDGTIADNATGLTWEKLSNDASVHNVNQTYTWAQAFTKVATLNSPPGFAGHRDWRLPNRRELESLVYSGESPVTIAAAFATPYPCQEACGVTACSCTQGDYYWSATTIWDTPSNAWAVNFLAGDMNAFDKSTAYYVRAVRGGLTSVSGGG